LFLFNIKFTKNLFLYQNGASIYLNHEIFKNESLLNEFLGPFQDNEIVEFSETMKSIYNLIVNEYERLLFQNKKKMSINQVNVNFKFG